MSTLAAEMLYKDEDDHTLNWRLNIWDNDGTIVVPYDLQLDGLGVPHHKPIDSLGLFTDMVNGTSLDFTVLFTGNNGDTGFIEILLTSDEGRFSVELHSNSKGAGWIRRFWGNLVRNYDPVTIDKYPIAYGFTAICGLT